MHTFYVSDPIHPDVLDELNTLGQVHLGYGENAVPYALISDQVDAVLLRAERFDREKIQASPRLRIIARHGVGSDNVDISAATEAGVFVTVTPGSNSRAVAEHVFALLLALARKVPYGAWETAAGRWDEAKANMNGFELHGKTLGLLGFGNIARMVLSIAQGFGMKALVHDPFVEPSVIGAAGALPASRDEVLAESDVVSLHLPLTEETTQLINADTLAAMRPGSVLINTSRGGLIDEPALVAALTGGHLAAAALDVVQGESVDMKNPLPHSGLPIGGLPNLIVTPHVGGQSSEAFLAAGTGALAAIRQVLAGEHPAHALNTVPAPAYK
ncbi:hydroxyacid dehydrogenase [Arthrobacter sp. Marseille-P9274]|uniref:hydroxyacid dehydrogenase n=1 Tax=Arthrobacter sp. Marseille-P9274 TaxID=2866572 RepID=UPI0021C8D617|nr:hydroxyacid dehydrogenase [Arthrobacter sp. Marseille-P9274]